MGYTYVAFRTNVSFPCVLITKHRNSFYSGIQCYQMLLYQDRPIKTSGFLSREVIDLRYPLLGWSLEQRGVEILAERTTSAGQEMDKKYLWNNKNIWKYGEDARRAVDGQLFELVPVQRKIAIFSRMIGFRSIHPTLHSIKETTNGEREIQFEK